MTANVLEKISAARRRRLEDEKTAEPLEALEEIASSQPQPLKFAEAFPPGRVNIIAEVKRASPSRGLLRVDFDPETLAQTYESAGACAVSVLTEQDHFMGSLEYLERVRAHVSVPILRKDFLTDPYQVVEARAAGADSFLLIAALLDAGSLRSLIDLGRTWGMEPLVEVHDERELAVALECGAEVVGINNRDLNTLHVDLGVTLRLAPHVPENRIVISESGIKISADIVRLKDAGVRGFLIGESLVTAVDPKTKLKDLVNGNC
ncbi:MAG: indole-3-glycerol phosphate synthase TrpC [Desulfomonile sp.]|nr:indole-3-glycerol phosphate synthase TrpC [Desulfomonile sp.]